MTRAEKYTRYYELRAHLNTCKEEFHTNPSPDSEKRFYEQVRKLDDFEQNDMLNLS